MIQKNHTETMVWDFFIALFQGGIFIGHLKRYTQAIESHRKS